MRSCGLISELVESPSKLAGDMDGESLGDGVRRRDEPEGERNREGLDGMAHRRGQ